MRRILIGLVCGLFLTAPCSGRQLETTIRLGNAEIYCKVDCGSTSLSSNHEWAALEVSYKNAGDQNRKSSGTRIQLDGLRCPNECKAYTLAAGSTSNVNAVIVSGEGYTRNWVYVIRVTPKLPAAPDLHALLKESYDGDVHYTLSDKRTLKAIRLEYIASHIVGDKSFSGHVLLTRDFNWSETAKSFKSSPLRVDVDAEAKATLAEILMIPGADRLGVTCKSDGKTGKSICYFRPKGILREKIPVKLRSAPMVQVTVGYKNGSVESKPIILDIRSVSYHKEKG